MRVLFEFIHEALHPLILLCHCMSTISSPQAAIALDEKTDCIARGNLDYGLGTGVKRAWHDYNGKGQKKTIWFHASIH
jgi:hypothetical protein